MAADESVEPGGEPPSVLARVWEQVSTLGLAIAIALATVVQGVDGGAAEVLRTGAEAGKLRFFDTSFSLAKPYTLWTALTAIALGNVGAFGTDHLLA